MWYRDFLQQVIYKIINPLIKGMIKIGVTPNLVTTVGFIGNIIAAAFFIVASQMSDLCCQATYVGWGGFIIIASGLFDMMDGRLARMGNMSSSFGAMWDSTLDRYSELVSLFGIVLVFLENEGWFWMGVVTFAAMVGSVMVSYVRARAEGLGLECKVGFMQRPERVVVTALTAVLTGVTGSLWWLAGGMILIAVLANITAFWRVAYCYGKLNARDKANKSAETE
jgi:CDP-diacylglycerol---glycerol-3-phosphate 3-phosphatidyltransferase